MRIEAEGYVCRLNPNVALRYRISLPADEPIAPKLCVVCGVEFVPAFAHVKTCGQSCGESRDSCPRQ